MMAASRKQFLALLFLLSGIASVQSDEAVESTGKKHVGSFMHNKHGWVFQVDQGKPIPHAQLAYVRFEAKTTPLPKAPLARTLLLPNGQRITGTLVSLDEKKIVFTASWGKSLTLDREQITGIEQTELPIAHDVFEMSLKAWRVEGKPALSKERAFFGHSSLLLDAAGQSVMRDWQSAPRDLTIRLFFYDPANASNLRWYFAIIPATARDNFPALVIDKEGYRCDNVKQRYAAKQAAAGWHLLAIEKRSERVRFFVDDDCLGETTATIEGMRIAVTGKGEGKLWIDEFAVTRPLPTGRRPAPIKEQDTLWLEQDEQFFGRVPSADADGVVLIAKFGKRSFAWSKLRGILFALKEKEPASELPEIYFRPGPGFPVDCLRAKLLRWEEGKLIVQHALLGEIAIERARLDRIRFVAK